jgi:hypothetical protein
VLVGWEIGLMMMEVGSGRRLYCCMWCYQSFETDPVICYLCRIFSDAVFLYPLKSRIVMERIIDVFLQP